jgi:RNA polymerase sigma-70 factor (ECF subfamily)
MNDPRPSGIVSDVSKGPVAEDESGTSEQQQPPLHFEVFYRSERARLFGTLALVTGDRSESEELVQESFVRVWEHWARVSAHPDPVGYLYRTAFNLVRQRRRAFKRAIARAPMSEPWSGDPFDRSDELADVAAAMRTLTVRQRAAIVLTDLLDLSAKDAAGLMGVRPGTVRSLASQARSVLREALGELDG